MKQEVFISYSWYASGTKSKSPSPIVDLIVKELKANNFQVTIDKKTVQYKDNIKQFEERLGRGDKIILIVSDKFLRSRHCMYEMLKIREKGNVHERIFPIVLDDAKIYDPVDLLRYVRHWEKEIVKLNNKRVDLDSQANTPSTSEAVNNYTEFRKIIEEIIMLLANMNTLSPQDHLESNFSELIEKLKDNKIVVSPVAKLGFGDKIAKTNRLFESAIELVSNELQTQENGDVDILDRIKHWHAKCKSQTFQIGVMAMLKSGKSSFLNALMGEEFLPMSNVAETAVPVKIVHSDVKEPYLNVSDNENYYGVNDITSFLKKKNEQQRNKGSEKEIQPKLFSQLVSLNELPMSDIKFEIIDTPGFGEALNEVVGKSIDQTNTELLDQISVIIYILDYSKLGTKDEDEVLKKFSEVRPDLLEKIQDRLFLIINKLDQKDRNSKSPEETVEHVLKLFRPKMPKIKREHIFHISAKTALLSRLVINGKASLKAKQDFAEMAFGEIASEMEEDQYKMFARKLLMKSNINLVESQMLEFIYQERGRIFIETILDNLKRLLNEFKNKYVLTAHGALNATIAEVEALEKKLGEAKKKQENIQKEANNFEIEIKTWIESEFQKFEDNIRDDVDSIFNVKKAEQKKQWRSKILPKWAIQLQHRVASVFSSSSSYSPEKVYNQVTQLNDDITEQLFTQFYTFRTELELKMFEKQRELLGDLESTINLFARNFESTVGKSLNVSLISVELQLEKLDFDRMRNDADSVIDRFVTSKEELVKARKQREEYVPGTWCRSGRYETKTYIERTIANKYDISKESIELYWLDYIQERNENAKKMAIHFMDNHVQAQIKSARKRFDDYVDDYLSIIQEERARLASGDIAGIEARLEDLNTLNESTSKLLTQIDQLY